MIGFISRRLVSMLGVLLVLVAVMFLLQHYTPVNPIQAMLGAGATRQAVHRETVLLGYNKPLIVQYFHYVWGLLHGNFQMSLRTRDPVISDLASFGPATVELALGGISIAIFMGLVLGISMATGSRIGRYLRYMVLSGACIPQFLAAQVAVIVFYSNFHLLPASGEISTTFTNVPTGPTGMVIFDCLLHADWAAAWSGVTHLILPACCIAIFPSVAIARVLASSLSHTLGSDFVRTAEAKGLKTRSVVLRHSLRNSIGPAISMTGIQIGLMFAGVIVIEEVFAWPGIGNYVAQSIPAADFPAISGVTILLGGAYVVINAIVDILQALADPRVTLQ
jgi:peptide/nickel transport system permease protein